MKRLLILLAYIAVTIGLGLPTAMTPAKATTPYIVTEVPTCQLADYLHGLDAEGATLVSITPALLRETEDEEFCACTPRREGCFSLTGQRVVAVSVVWRAK